MVTRQEIEEFLPGAGFAKDRWGHYTRTGTDGRHHRYKLSRIMARLEVKSTVGWVRLRSGYYRDLSIVDGYIKGMKS